MVNTGRPSRACETCRRRRVKCDYRRPGCAKCERIGSECTYRNLESRELSFRNRTLASYMGSQQARRTQETQAISQPPKPVTESVDVHIMPLILSQFSLPGGAGRNSGRVIGTLKCFTSILPTAEPGSLMHLACTAVGVAWLSNQSNSSSLAILHQRAYGEALQHLRAALEHPLVQKQDSVLLAVWMLCVYELILGTSPGDSSAGPLNWATHSKALTGLLRARGEAQFATPTGCQLYQLTYHHIVGSFLVISAVSNISKQGHTLHTGSLPPPEAKQWFQTLSSVVDTNDPTYFFLRSFYCGDDAAPICSNAITSFKTATNLPAKLAVIESLSFAAQDLESRILSLRDKGPFSSILTSAQKPYLVIHIRNHLDHCLVRIYSILTGFVLDTIRQFNMDPELQETIQQVYQVSIHKSQEYADRILSTVPQLLPEKSSSPPGWADTLRLLGPLRIVLASPGTLDSQKETARVSLKRIAYEVGIRQAVGSFFGDIP
ncbi:hypothetical protein BDV18DRAFT_156238 [Aspergillus unguis]